MTFGGVVFMFAFAVTVTFSEVTGEMVLYFFSEDLFILSIEFLEL